MPQTQEQRRADTRRRLLDAARTVVADRGISAASVDAVAGAADRTSGALYDHFGGKEGLVLALLDEWKDATAEATEADLSHAEDPDGRLRSIWANFAVPTAEGGQEWVLLEHELWLHACRQADRQPELRETVAARYEAIRERMGAYLAGGTLSAGAAAAEYRDARARATLMIGLMVGLEMQRRVDPEAVDDALAVAGLRALSETAPDIPPNG